MAFVQYNKEAIENEFFFRTKVLEGREYRGVGFDYQTKIARSRVMWSSIFSEQWAGFQYKEKQDED